MLLDLMPQDLQQQDLFLPQKENKLDAVIDQINQRFGRNTLLFGAEGFEKPWLAKSASISPSYTTDWSQLVIAKS